MDAAPDRPSRTGGLLSARGLRRLVGEGLVATAHIALQLVWGTLAGAVVISLVAVGVTGLLALGLGALALLLALALARGLAGVERARLAVVLGAAIPAPAPLPTGSAGERLKALVASSTTWRALAWAALLPVLGLAWSLVVTTLWAVALLLATLPLWRGTASAAPGPGGWLAATGATGALAGPLLGLALAAVALLTARGCAAADVALARVLIGASENAALTARVQTLTHTRAGVVDTADAERRRIERDLHDGAQQRLVALAVTLGMASAKLDADPGAPEEARELVRSAHGEAKAALVELRDLARGIHPAVLTDRGLDAALSALAARSPVPVAVDVELPTRCSPTVEATAYFVVAEALTNLARHAGATRARVTVRRPGPALVVTVADDGRGGAEQALASGRGTGLAGLRSRVAGVDGALHLTSPPGGPTTLTVELPCTP